MNDINQAILDNDWDLIRKKIQTNQVDWNQLVDNTNSLIHYLVYQKKNNLIRMINKDILLNLIITQYNSDGDNVAHIAAKLRNLDLLYELIYLKPEIIYYQNDLGHTIFYYLANDFDFVKNILKAIKIQDHYISYETTFLEHYISKNEEKMLDYVLKHLDINKISNQMISKVIESNNDTDHKIKILHKLVNVGISVNELNDDFLSPIILATYHRIHPIIQFLLESGADPNCYGPENCDHPLSISIKNGETSIIKLLLEHDIDVNVPDKNLQTPIHFLFQQKNELDHSLKKKILQRVKNINAVDNNMDSILNLLIVNDNWKHYENILQKKKLKIYLQNKNGRCPIHSIQSKDLDRFFEIVCNSYITQLGLDKNWVDNRDIKLSKMLRSGKKVNGVNKSYIMNKIKNGQSYPLVRKRDLFRFIDMANTNITHFSAYTYNYICFLYYILRKYTEIKTPCIIPGQIGYKTINEFYKETIQNYSGNTTDHSIFRSILRDFINHSPPLVNHIIIWKDEKMYYLSPFLIDSFKLTLKKYPNTKFILLKLTIITDKNFNHANMLIYDINHHIMERFDPYGKVPFIDNDKINRVLGSFFEKNIPSIQYISTDKLLNSISFQIFSDESNPSNYIENDPSGFCMVWCLWYIEMRIKNYHIHPKNLIKKSIYQINRMDKKFKDYIRDYSNYLDSEKNIILAETSLPKKYWYMQHIPTPLYKSYLSHIRKMYNAMIN